MTEERSGYASYYRHVERQPLREGNRVWAKDHHILNAFKKALIFSIVLDEEGEKYSILCVGKHEPDPNFYTRKELAFRAFCYGILPVGTRVVAREEENLTSPYIGIVAETPNSSTEDKYLVFFDIGCEYYVSEDDIFLVCDQSKDVHLDIVNSDVSEHCRLYLRYYPEFPRERYKIGDKLLVFKAGLWYGTEVIALKASLIKVRFPTLDCEEWIYRGSYRLRKYLNGTSPKFLLSALAH